MENLPIEPFGVCLLVRLDDVEDKVRTSGIIIQTEKDMRFQDTGEVVAMGPMAFSDYDKCPLELGDRVVFNTCDCPYFDFRDKDDHCYRVVTDIKVFAKVKKGVTNE